MCEDDDPVMPAVSLTGLPTGEWRHSLLDQKRGVLIGWGMQEILPHDEQQKELCEIYGFIERVLPA